MTDKILLPDNKKKQNEGFKLVFIHTPAILF